MIETSQMQTLVAVAQSASFSKAAENLGVTQSAISQSIKNLEVKLSTKIFNRASKKIILTDEGEKVYSLSVSFLNNYKEMLDEIHLDQNEMRGQVRIGTLAGIGKSWLAQSLMDYSNVYDELTISLDLGFQERLVKSFEEFQLDILILPEYCIPNNGEKVFIGEEKSILVFPDSKNYNITKNTSLEELSSFPTILFQNQGDSLYKKWSKKHFGVIPKQINKRYIINSHGNMLQAVQRGLGVAVIPKHVFLRSYYKDKVKYLEGVEVSNGKFFVIYHKEAKNNLRIKKTLDVLLSEKNPLM